MNIKDLIKQHLNEAKTYKVAGMTLTVSRGDRGTVKEVDHNSVEADKAIIKSLKISAKPVDDRYGETYLVTVKADGKTAKFSVYRNDEDYKGKHSFNVRSIDKVVPELKDKLIAYLEGNNS